MAGPAARSPSGERARGQGSKAGCSSTSAAADSPCGGDSAGPPRHGIAIALAKQLPPGRRGPARWRGEGGQPRRRRRPRTWGPDHVCPGRPVPAINDMAGAFQTAPGDTLELNMLCGTGDRTTHVSLGESGQRRRGSLSSLRPAGTTCPHLLLRLMSCGTLPMPSLARTATSISARRPPAGSWPRPAWWWIRPTEPA